MSHNGLNAEHSGYALLSRLIWPAVFLCFATTVIFGGATLRMRTVLDDSAAASDRAAIELALASRAEPGGGSQGITARNAPEQAEGAARDPERTRRGCGAQTVRACEALEDVRAIAAERRFKDVKWVKSDAGLPASLPVRNPDGTIDGYLAWTPARPGTDLLDRLGMIAAIGVAAIFVLFGGVVIYLVWVAQDLERHHAQSQEMLGRDPLSGLANRLQFNRQLHAALRALPTTDRGLAVVFIDLDKFKDVNDTFGHKAGDDLIKLVALRLTGVVRSGDVLARFGGDEFAILLTDVRSQEDAEILSRRVMDALTRPFAIAHTQVNVGASLGISLAPENGTTPEELIALADTALYQAKSEGRNRYRFFQVAMDETIQMRRTVEEDLRNAIANDELLLEYQPVYSIEGTKIVGLEALVRWPHPVRGRINPGEFIGIAEERGLIIPLGEWVLRRACEDCKRWPGLWMAVNVSAIQFRHRDYVASVIRVLEETKLDPTLLELELTEGVVVGDADAAEDAMMNLRALGVNLALDDFGTGYSSLIYLRRFAFDKIKIDRSFLESMEATGESAILVHSIVHLGRALGLTVTAEGVETQDQHRFLQALGCHQVQGFLFSRPLPREAIDRLVGLPGKSEAA